MDDRMRALEERVDGLTARVQSLALLVERLTSRLEASGLTLPGDATGEAATAAGEPAPVSDELLGWAGRASLLPRLATLCFLLVIALALRTVSAYSPGFRRTGALVGMVYAAALMASGWRLYARSRPLAPVFAATGAILMSVIVAEAQLRFHALSAPAAYALLVATGVGMALTSRRFDRFLPISVGILGMCLASVWIDWPTPYFPVLAMVLLTANLLGWFASRIQKCSWLRWTVLVVSTVMLYFLWGYKVVALAGTGAAVPPRLAAPLLVPVLALFALVYAGLALAGFVKRGDGRPSRFDLALPVINVVWVFFACAKVVGVRQGNLHALGAAGVLGALAHFGVAARLARRDVPDRRGTAAFALAGSGLLAMALPYAVGSLLIALPLLSAAAFGLALASGAWRSRGVRWTSTLMQIGASVALSLHLRGNARFTASVASAAAAAAPACIGFLHYRWLRLRRRRRAAEDGAQFETGDARSVLLLMASLLGAFFMLRVGIWQALSRLPVSMQDSFPCAQSILINAAAAVLMLIALARRDREVRNVAILVTILGGLKVFFFDLLATRGIPQTASVFVFGVAAAVESVALGRWSRAPGANAAGAAAPAPDAPGPEPSKLAVDS